jgi:hypothetical protein
LPVVAIACGNRFTSFLGKNTGEQSKPAFVELI